MPLLCSTGSSPPMLMALRASRSHAGGREGTADAPEKET